jgi:hypothetical protein
MTALQQARILPDAILVRPERLEAASQGLVDILFHRQEKDAVSSFS